MQQPQPGDYIDIHSHGGQPSPGIFILESLMAHENKLPVDNPGIAFTYGIHPWFLNEDNHVEHILSVEKIVRLPFIIAVGEAGFDRLRGPVAELQRTTFEEQVLISEEARKPMVIHCVRGWDELLSVQKRLRPEMPWLVHGFRGNTELANQLLSKGMFLSFWFEFVLRPESAGLLRALPHDRIFLETDGADVDIKNIYNKVAIDLKIEVEQLKKITFGNFNSFFKVPPAATRLSP
jgi:TatD DNase family protein